MITTNINDTDFSYTAKEDISETRIARNEIYGLYIDCRTLNFTDEDDVFLRFCQNDTELVEFG
jgi:hypothetical protein